MKIMTILGSPKKNGNTATILNALEEKLKNKCEIERVNVIDKNIKGCLGCSSCQKIRSEPGCVQKDDFAEIVNRMMNSDITIYASPVYCWDFTAQMKTLIDRSICLVKYFEPTKYLIDNKRVILLTTCGGDEENNADIIKQIFKRAMDFAHCRIIGIYVVPECSTPSELGDKIKIVDQIEFDIFNNKI
jgi:multimeric flavodoxin WrbA